MPHASAAWRCPTCGGVHPDLPFGFDSPAPARVLAVPATERAGRARLTAADCVLDGTQHFLKGHLEIPVLGQGRDLTWGVWVRVVAATWEQVRAASPFRPSGQGPWLGRLDTALPAYEPGTIDLRVLVHEPRPGAPPFVEVEPTGHPLAREQREGVPLARVREIAGLLWHLEDAG